jgi:hypothetical protein
MTLVPLYPLKAAPINARMQKAAEPPIVTFVVSDVLTVLNLSYSARKIRLIVGLVPIIKHDSHIRDKRRNRGGQNFDNFLLNFTSIHTIVNDSLYSTLTIHELR